MSEYTYNTSKAARLTELCVRIAQDRWGDVILQATPQVWADGTVSVCVANRPQSKEIVERRIRFHEDMSGKRCPQLAEEVTQDYKHKTKSKTVLDLAEYSGCMV